MENIATPKKKLSGFAKGMLAFVLVLCIAIGGLWAALWGILKNYEYATPRAAMNDYFTHLAAKDYGDIQAQSGFSPDAYNSWEDYFALLHAQFGENPAGLSYRQALFAEAGAGQTWAVYQGEEKLGEVVVSSSAEAAHGWAVRAAIGYLPPYTIMAPGHVQVFENGTPLQPDPAAITQTPVASFANFPDESLIPYMAQYQTGQTLREPQFTATLADGTPCDVAVDATARTVTATAPLSEEQRAQYAARVEQVAKVYANFVTRDAPFADLRKFLIEGTPLYQRMRGFDNSWYLDHEGFAFEDLIVENLVSTSETTFTGNISFTYIIYRKGNVQPFPSAYHMSFVLVGGEWMLADLQVK